MDQLPDLAFTTLLDTTFEEALDRVTAALKEEGFGVLTEIDVKATMKKKMDKDFRNYKILGACNPPFAYQALTASLDVGLMLPCNIIVYETDEGQIRVSAINPAAALGVMPQEGLTEVSAEVSEKLKAVVDKTARA